MIIVDTNQAHRLPTPRQFAQSQLCIPELVLAEVAVRPGEVRSRIFRQWRRYRVRLGLQPAQVLADIAGLDAQSIPAYRPFATPLSAEARLLSQGLRGRLDDSTFRAWAAKARQLGLDFGQEMERRANIARPLLRAKKVGRAADMADVAALWDDTESYVGSLMISGIRDGRRRTPLVDDDQALYEGLKANPFLRHFMKGLLFYTVAISRLWDDQPMNMDPGPKRNDFTDLTLPLYVKDERDIVWTEDTFARNLLRATESGVRIKP